MEERMYTGYEGERYSTEVKKIEGYKVVEEERPENVEGIMKEEIIVKTTPPY